MSEPKAPENYRSAAREIEQILQAIEADREVDIDELADRVERASGLIRYCYDRLNHAELRIENVTRELSEATAPPASDSADENSSASESD